MNTKTVLVLGGGIGGLVTASLLKDKLKEEIGVELIERKKTFDFPPSYPWLMLGMRRKEQVQKNLDLLRRKKRIQVLNDEVLSIDIEGKSVLTKSSGKRPFDYLVIALGADFSPPSNTGFLRTCSAYIRSGISAEVQRSCPSL